jgi:hypothetical protein
LFVVAWLISDDGFKKSRHDCLSEADLFAATLIADIPQAQNRVSPQNLKPADQANGPPVSFGA